MVSRRHRNARPVPSRHVRSQIKRPRFKPNPFNYSHINIREQALVDEEPLTNDKEDDFIRKESLQVEIEEQLLYQERLISTPESSGRPRTFAEATMSTQSRSRGVRKDSLKDCEATLNGPMSLESLGPFKYTFKKKKKPSKWSPFDLAGADSTSEVGSNSEVDVGSSRAVSPNLSTNFGSTSSPSSPQRSTSTLAILARGRIKNRRRRRLTAEFEAGIKDIEETHQTPAPDDFEFAPVILTPIRLKPSGDTDSFLDRIEYNCSLDEVESDTSDTQSTKDRTESAMASIAGAFGAINVPMVGEDVFDSVEWDPSLPSVSTSDSPEPIIVAPQPLTYTTVGSLVNPNVVHQFTAPNRIQREGAGRRPLMTFIQNRPFMPNRHQESSYFHPRDPPPPLSMQNSMQYAQQLNQTPLRFGQAQQSTSSTSLRSTISLTLPSLTDEELKVLKRVGAPKMLPGNISGSPASQDPSKKSFPSTESPENKGFAAELSPSKTLQIKKDLPIWLCSNNEEAPRRSTNLSGLEKMQTIQRLAKFENPMQELARSRLSQLSVTNCLGRTVANPNGYPTASPSPKIESMSRKATTPKAGELDRGYQFPPPGFGTPSIAQVNPLYGAYGASTYQAPTGRAAGLPQPLTAGPPGNRNFLGVAASKTSTPFNESRQLGVDVNSSNASCAESEHTRNTASDSRSQFYSTNINQRASNNTLSQVLTISSSLSQSSYQQRAPAFEGEVVGSKLVDSLPISAIVQYYPNGLPSSMDGKHKPLSYKMMVKMGEVPGVCEPVTVEEKAAARREEVNDLFYNGQRHYGKTVEHHICDMERREHNQRTSPFGAIGLPSKKIASPIEKKLFTVEDMKNMTTAEAAVPVVDALFGTLLAYADVTSDYESRRHLSGYEKSGDELIDSSDKGNISYFGEDWGPPPNRVYRVLKD